MSNRIWLLSIMIVLSSAFNAFTAEITTSVKYVSSSTVYLDAGISSGVAAGDTVKIYKGDILTALLEIIFTADNSASCRIITQNSDIALTAGMIAVVSIADKSSEESRVFTVENIPLVETVESNPLPASSQQETLPKRVTGRIGVQYYAQDNLDAYDYDFSQPSLLLNLNFLDILGPHYDLTLRMRTRREIIAANSQNPASTSWDNRLYQFVLHYNDPQASYNFSVGRTLSNDLAGVGYLDGAVFGYRLHSRFKAGIFGGTQPDLTTSQFSSDQTKAGVYAAYTVGDYTSKRLNITAAAAGQYIQGIIDREFLYAQIDYTLGTKFSFFQSSEIDIDRGWRKQASGKSLQLSNILLNARYYFTRNFSLDLGYDNRKNVYTYYTRSIPDSLFDDALRQGYKAGVNFRLPKNIRIGLNSNYRNDSDGNSSTFYSGSIGTVNFLNSGTTVSFRTATYDNLYSSGLQNAISLSRYFFEKLNLGAAFGINNYNYKTIGYSVSNNWVQFNGDYFFSRRLYGSANVELSRGSDFNSNRYFLDFGIRF